MHNHFKKFSRTGLFLIGVSALCVSGTALAQDDLGLDLPPVEEEPAMDLPEDSAIQPLLPGAEPMETVSENEPVLADDPAIQEVDAPPPAPAPADLSSPTMSDEPMAMPDIPETAQQEEFDENLFFDAEALVPESELARKAAPSKVNPALNPGSRLVVTRTNASPDSKEARLVAAERAMKLGRYDSAVQIYNELYAANKRDPNVLLGRATALQYAGNEEEALYAYEELLNARPKNVEAQINMQGLLSKRYPAVALRNLTELQQDNPGNSKIVAQMAVVSAQLGQYPEAIRYLGVAASMEPENAGHIYNMAVIADRAGDKKAAIKYYEEALEIDTLYGGGATIPRDSVFQRLAQLR